jgi:hypothetical protein
MLKYIVLIVSSIVALLINRLLTAIPSNEFYSKIAEFIIFNGVQFSVLLFVGWATFRFYRMSLTVAAGIATVVFAIDHFGLRTLYLLIIFSGSSHTIPYGIYTVLIQSFLLFVPVVLLLGAGGGYLAKKRMRASAD